MTLGDGMTDGTNMGSTELAALHAIAESTKATAALIATQLTELRSLSSAVNDVRERVIRLEEQRHGHDIAKLVEAKQQLDTRISALELSQATMIGKFQGANTLMTMIQKYVPWIGAAIFAAVTYYNTR